MRTYKQCVGLFLCALAVSWGLNGYGHSRAFGKPDRSSNYVEIPNAQRCYQTIAGAVSRQCVSLLRGAGVVEAVVLGDADNGKVSMFVFGKPAGSFFVFWEGQNMTDYELIALGLSLRQKRSVTRVPLDTLERPYDDTWLMMPIPADWDKADILTEQDFQEVLEECAEDLTDQEQECEADESRD